MAIPAARLIPDENLDILFTGGAIHMEKTDGSKAQRKGGAVTGGAILGEKTDGSKAQKEGGAITGGAILGEKTDGSKAQKNQEIIEEQSNIMVELVGIYDDFGGYGHNHEECIEEERNRVDFVGCGLDDIHDGPPFLPLASKLRSHPPMPSEELYEWGEPLVFEESPFEEEMPVLGGFDSPDCLSHRPTWPMLFHEKVYFPPKHPNERHTLSEVALQPQSPFHLQQSHFDSPPKDLRKRHVVHF